MQARDFFLMNRLLPWHERSYSLFKIIRSDLKQQFIKIVNLVFHGDQKIVLFLTTIKLFYTSSLELVLYQVEH